MDKLVDPDMLEGMLNNIPFATKASEVIASDTFLGKRGCRFFNYVRNFVLETIRSMINNFDSTLKIQEGEVLTLQTLMSIMTSVYSSFTPTTIAHRLRILISNGVPVPRTASTPMLLKTHTAISESEKDKRAQDLLKSLDAALGIKDEEEDKTAEVAQAENDETNEFEPDYGVISVVDDNTIAPGATDEPSEFAGNNDENDGITSEHANDKVVFDVMPPSNEQSA